MDEITIADVIQWGITILLFVIAFLYTWYSKRVRGPEFGVPEVYLTEKNRLFSHDPDSVRDQIRIQTVIQNIGDRAGYLRIETAKVIVKNDTNSFEGLYYGTDKGRNIIFKFNRSIDKIEPIVLLVGESTRNFIEMPFDFVLPEEATDWIEATLILEGKYALTHKEEMKPFKKALQVEIGDFTMIEQVINGPTWAG